MSIPPGAFPSGDDQVPDSIPAEPAAFSSEYEEPVTDEQQVELYPISTLPQLPPEAQGETHGGPLGCCLGTVVGLLLTPLLMLGVSLLLANGAFLGVATLPVALLGAAICGYFGWKIGRRLYKEYDPPVVKARRKSVRVKTKRA